MAETLPAHVRGLLRASAYPHPAPGLKLLQTHISYVILAGDDVYKLKKPVDFGFVDFTTLEKRKADCEAEVHLNRRACEGVYYGVVPVTRSGHRYRVGGEGEVVDYAVHMKRLPEEAMMDVLLARDAVDFDMVGRLVARLAGLHASAETSAEITRLGGSETLRENWRENLETVRPFIGSTLSARLFDRVERYVARFFEREQALLRRREGEGRIRDCHGDLRSDAVCFDPTVPGGICIYDCIEFNDRFRYSDTGLDVAFLAMDLEFRGRRDLSDLFIGLYVAASGDRELPLLLDFYKCYRAWTRGKVESLLLLDAGVARNQKTAARRRARAYFRLAETLARRPRTRRALLVTGPSGSGKSVLAGVLAARLGAVLLSTDMIRREAGLAAGRRDLEEVDRGRYSTEARLRVYELLAGEARSFLEQGRPVVLDGTFVERVQRDLVRPVIESAGVPFLLIECTAPDEVVEQRQKRRATEAWTASEGRYDVYLAQKQRYEPPLEFDAARRISIDTTLPLETQVGLVLDKLA